MVQLLLITGLMIAMLTLIGYQIYSMRWLHHHGRRVVAMVTSIRRETGKTAWGIARENYYVTAAWTNPRTGRRYTFWTWIMNGCPEQYRTGSLVPVLIDPEHPECSELEL